MNGDEKSGRKNQYSAPALEKGFDVFELLASFPEGLTISEIATRLDRSINELFRLIVVMERRGYLHKDPESDRYSVAYKILDIAYRATPVQNLTQIAAPLMYQLARQAVQSCHLVVVSERGGLVIACEENPGPTNFGVRLGARVNLFESCSGNVLLAFSTAQRRESIVPLDENGQPRSTKPLAPVLKRIHDQGYERRKSPMTYGVIDISHPVFGFDGHIAAALTIPFLERIDGSHPVNVDDAQAYAAETARRISAGLGWHGEAAGTR